jgi:LysR family transcriptional regulator, transcriptional activator of the cysJI operon
MPSTPPRTAVAPASVLINPVARLDNFRLVVFRAVARHLSFRKAAEELYLTQPAVSQQVKALEEELSVQLFDRSATEVRLSPAGKILLKRAQQSSSILAHAEQEIAALSGAQAGPLTLGASTTIAQYVLPGLLSEFCRTRPRIFPTLLSGNTERIVQAVEDHSIALGFIEGPPHSRAVKAEPFLQDELVLIVPAAHAWAERKSIAPAEIADAPLLARERGSGTRQVLEQALVRAGVKKRALHVVMELDATEAIKSSVEAGFGVGFVSRWAIAKDLRLGKTFKIVEVEGLRIRRSFLVVRAKSAPLQSVAEEFRRFLCARPGAAPVGRGRPNQSHSGQSRSGHAHKPS